MVLATVQYCTPSLDTDFQLLMRIVCGLETMRTTGLYIWGIWVHPVGAWPPRVEIIPVTKVINFGSRGEIWESIWELVRQLKLPGGKDSWNVLLEGSGLFWFSNLTVNKHSMPQEMKWTQVWPLPVLGTRTNTWTRRGSGIKKWASFPRWPLTSWEPSYFGTSVRDCHLGHTTGTKRDGKGCLHKDCGPKRPRDGRPR